MTNVVDIKEIYDFDYFSINKTKLINALECIKSKYSITLAFLIAKMLHMNENDRLSSY
jgi:hypothetical protein